MDTKNLLTIGGMAKLSGASIHSLRYYERKNLLKPAYIDPSSGYRYYSAEQSYLVNIIKLCVEFDIPLKELTKFIDQDSLIDISALLAHGKDNAQKKLNTLEYGLRVIDALEKKIALTEKYRQHEIYERVLPEIKFYSAPYENSFDSISTGDWIEIYSNIEYNEDDYEYEEMPEFGLMSKHTMSGICRYAVLEIPKHKSVDLSDDNILTIPGGTSFCMQSDESQIENAPEIFKDYIKGAESFWVIESALVSSKNKVNKLITEMRVKVCT